MFTKSQITSLTFTVFTLSLLLSHISIPLFAQSDNLPPGEAGRYMIQFDNHLANFPTYVQIPDQSLTIPTVLEIPITTNESRSSTQAIYETTTATFQPFRIVETKLIPPYTMDSIYRYTRSDGSLTDEMLFSGDILNDQNESTYLEYLPALDSQAIFEYVFPNSITTNSLEFTLPDNVPLPDTISVSYSSTSYGEKIPLLIDIPVKSNTISFPQTNATRWTVAFSYSQNFRISELKFIILNPPTSQAIRFLARPGEDYQLYLSATNYVNIRTPESGNLASPTNTVTLSQNLTRLPNPLYQKPDRDSDGIPDDTDNCPYIANRNQLDKNNDNMGDACQDFDDDGIYNTEDNCPDHPNRNQQDSDVDGIGDHCDPDESRLTERLFWLPWAGIGLGFLVVLILFKTTNQRHKLGQNSTDTKQPSDPYNQNSS